MTPGHEPRKQFFFRPILAPTGGVRSSNFIHFYMKIRFFFYTTHNPLKSSSEIGGQYRQYNTLDTTQTHTQAKNYSFSQSPSTDNSAEKHIIYCEHL
jgi:hypothetical protein